MSRFTGKVAIVTGGASGIGAAIGCQLVAEGASVVLFDRNAEGLAEKTGATVAVSAGDVTDEQDVQAAVSRAVERFGGVDLAFNVAGAVRMGAITDISTEDWTFTVDVAFKGTFLVTRHAARAMRSRGGGAIVNVASLNAHVPMYGGSSYAAAKAGVENFTKGAALELADERIRVNAVLPGLVDTPLTESFFEVAELAQDFTNRIPLRRPAVPDEIADPCLYLASEQAGYITGTSVVVDGGWEISNYPDLKTYQ